MRQRIAVFIIRTRNSFVKTMQKNEFLGKMIYCNQINTILIKSVIFNDFLL